MLKIDTSWATISSTPLPQTVEWLNNFVARGNFGNNYFVDPIP
jgi:hypothetical protein